MPKMTIYVQDELQEAMEKVVFPSKELSWSSLAQEAFSREVSRYAERMKIAPKLQDAVDRVRRSKERSENADKAAGDAAGRRWAMEQAEYVELMRLDRFRDRVRAGKVKWDSSIGKCWPIFEVIKGYGTARSEAYDPEECVEFWSQFTDAEASDEFVDAFWQGAFDAWIRIQLEL